ncbi:MAG: ribosome maturation factor RimP [Acidobacteriota bacterium]
MVRLPEEVQARLARLAASEGVELVAVEVGGTPRRSVVRLILDRAEGGVSLAHCELVSRQASVLLDAHDPFPGPYSLEVSSPGLDRKLFEDGDFVRFSGRMVRVRMRPIWRGPRIIKGTLEGRAGGFVRVNDGTTTHLLPEPEVFETRLAPFDDEKAPAGPRGKRKQT